MGWQGISLFQRDKVIAKAATTAPATIIKIIIFHFYMATLSISFDMVSISICRDENKII